MYYEVAPSTLKLIEGFEGIELSAYQDSAGIWTIGWGCTNYLDGSIVKEGDTITQQQADNMLSKQVSIRLAQINPHLPVGLTQNMVDSLVSCAYNIGVPAFLKSTLLKRVNANKLDPAITDAFLMWDKITKNGKLMVLEDLLERRKKEAQVYFS